jgi:hypothetical protein
LTPNPTAAELVEQLAGATAAETPAQFLAT